MPAGAGSWIVDMAFTHFALMAMLLLCVPLRDLTQTENLIF